MSDLPVKAAVDIAKRYVADLFAEEGVINLGLEEVDYDEAFSIWRITVGFFRKIDPQGPLEILFAKQNRNYKVVSIDRAGKVLSVKNRESMYAG